MKHNSFFLRVAIILSLCCFGTYSVKAYSAKSIDTLRDNLYDIVNSVSGIVGIALVSDGDTIAINNDVPFPMMSVFKLHQSLAVADVLQRRHTDIDTTLFVHTGELDRNTWSPMLKHYGHTDFHIPVRELLRFAITSSDNNASNLLFKHIISPSQTDSCVKALSADTTFSIFYSEAQMKANHDLSYCNFTSPLSAAQLIKQVFESDLVNARDMDFIRECLTSVTTGQDRLGVVTTSPLIARFGHKTGSGFRNVSGELMAHNDVGYFVLADGRRYSLAVFIRDFSGSEQEASRIIAEISTCVFRHLTEAE